MEDWTRTVKWFISPEQVVAFRQALDRASGRTSSVLSADHLPATYSIRAFGGDKFCLDEVYDDVGIDVARTLHTGQTFEWGRALQLGECLTVNMRVLEQSRGMSERAGSYVRTTLCAEAIDDQRNMVLQAEHQTIELECGHFPLRGHGDDRRVSTEAESASGYTVKLQHDDLRRYAQAARDMNPIHLDEGFVRAAGGDEVVVHGMLGAGVATQLAWQEPADDYPLSLDIRFKAPVWTQEALEVRVWDRQRRADRMTFQYDLAGLDGQKTVCQLVTSAKAPHPVLGRSDKNGLG